MARFFAACDKCDAVISKTDNHMDQYRYDNPRHGDDVGECEQVKLDGTSTPFKCDGRLLVFQIIT